MQTRKEKLHEEACYIRDLFTDLAKWAQHSDNADLLKRYEELIALPDKEVVAYARRHDIKV